MIKPKIQDKPIYCNAWAIKDSDTPQCNSIPCCGFCVSPKIEAGVREEGSFTDYDKVGLHPLTKSVKATMPKYELPVTGNRVIIPVSKIEFVVGGNTIWIQDRRGGTAIRIKTYGTISVDVCENSPLSHGDIEVKQSIEICLSKNAKF